MESENYVMPARHLCVIGDVHGHLQLALCVAARWQRELNVCFDAVLLCGDVGTFTSESQLDNATRRHARQNPCELEFMQVWAAEGAPRWLNRLFESADRGGLGLTCPIVMVHGNHEGFEHLETLLSGEYPGTAIPMAALPAVDACGWIRYLPSGCQCVSPCGLVVSGIGGIQEGQRAAKYHPLAYIDVTALERLEAQQSADLLITHQGPARFQGDGGAELFDLLLDKRFAPVWCHGHSVRDDAIRDYEGMTIVPLHDIAFETNRDLPDDPGLDGWADIRFGPDGVQVTRQRPSFWRDYRRRRWEKTPDGVLVCPDLAR